MNDFREWEYFLHDKRYDTVRSVTGYDVDVLTQCYRLLYGFISQEDLFDMWKYIHLYPQPRSYPSIMRKPYEHFRQLKYVFRMYHALLRDAINADVRYEIDNHNLFFPFNVTGCADSVPIYVVDSARKSLGHMYFNGKHGRTALEFTAFLTFKGKLAFFEGPFLPTVI